MHQFLQGVNLRRKLSRLPVDTTTSKGSTKKRGIREIQKEVTSELSSFKGQKRTNSVGCPLRFQLQTRSVPKTRKYSIRKLKSMTMLKNSNSAKPSFIYKPKKAQKWNSMGSSDAYLQTDHEYNLSKLYSQSIKVQKYLKTKPYPHKLEKKLLEINSLIHRENCVLSSINFLI